MPYDYDVFLSYSHDYPFGEWVESIFLPLFKGYIKAALNREPRLFFDRESLGAGLDLEAKLKNTLANSRCLVGIWSPNYFLSRWCKFECVVMLYRENRLGYRTPDRPDGLVIPVYVHDGDKFPEYARGITFLDWRRYARVGDGFKKTEAYSDFQEKVSRFADDVANAVAKAPDWDGGWLSDEWFSKAAPESFRNEAEGRGSITDFPPPSLD